MHRNDEEDLQALGYYSNSATTQRRLKNGITVALLVSVWYVTAVITITSTKEIMNRLKFPFLLSSVQFIFASALSGLYLYFSKTYVSIPSSLSLLIFQISASYTFGFILTNSAFSIGKLPSYCCLDNLMYDVIAVTAAFAETIKSSEPISTVLIGLLFFNEGVSTRTYLTLIPICIGVGISCYNNDAFNAVGFALAAMSNICFSTRAVLAKKINISYPDSIDDINLFSSISLDGLVFLLPFTAIFEGRSILSYYHQSTAIQYENPEGHQSNITTLLELLLINGLMFATYNLVSYLVLRRTDLITHSVLNAFRRVFIILFTSFYFNHVLSSFNCLGITVAVIGVLMFGYFRSHDRHKSAS
jgi:solute carrier family 35 protein E1